jgi:gamma-glutamylcyclotransferase (GGCT)/AIG2-like uncharacterized protein YtfP
VYGTLKRGMSNHAVLGDSPYLYSDYIRGRLYDLGPYPAALRSVHPSEVIQGEVYECTDKQLQRLDRLEGNPILYKREKVNTTESEDEVWVYFYCSHVPESKRIGAVWPYGIV